MKKLKLVCLDAGTLGDDIDLKGIFGRFGEFVSYHKTDEDKTIDRLKDADIVLTNKALISSKTINSTNLKLICVTATGVNNIDLQAAAAAKIPVKNVAGYSTNSVVQQTFANILALRNSVAYYDSYCKSQNGWAKSDLFVHLDRSVFELKDKTFCVVGLGNIGIEVAKVARAFGCIVSYHSTSGKNNNDEFKKVNFDEVLNSDIISIHAPLNESSKGLFDEKALEKLKVGAILSNSGRGGIVDEKAVAKMIDKKEFYFATDVLQSEPMSQDHPFLGVTNKHRLLLTPHIAWASVEARNRLVNLVAKNIEEFLANLK